MFVALQGIDAKNLSWPSILKIIRGCLKSEEDEYFKVEGQDSFFKEFDLKIGFLEL